MSFVSIQTAANRISNLPAVNLATDLETFHIIHSQILGLQLDPGHKFKDDVLLNLITNTYPLVDTRPTEKLAFDDFRLTNLHVSEFLRSHPGVDIFTFNSDLKKQELAQIYPVEGQYVVPANVLYRNMVSYRGTVADLSFKDWIIRHLAVSYPNRVYSTTKFVVTFPVAAINHRDDAKLLLVTADHYLALPGLQYSLVNVDGRHFVKSGDSISISLTIESSIVESGGNYFFQSVIRDSIQSLVGCPVLLYVVADEIEDIAVDVQGLPVVINF